MKLKSSSFLFPLFLDSPAAIRTTFNFTREENFAFSGGDELWVYIDKELVGQIFTDPLETAVPCRPISLAGAGKLHYSLHSGQTQDRHFRFFRALKFESVQTFKSAKFV